MDAGERKVFGFISLLIASLSVSAHPPQAYEHPEDPPYPPQQYSPPTYLAPRPASYSPKSYYSSSYQKCDPYQVPVCALNNTLPFCLEDPEYPLEELRKIKINDWSRFQRLYADVTIQSANDLVDGLTKEEESSFDYSYYTGAKTFDITHWSGPAGYICPSNVMYAMPKRAKNVDGEWRVIYNDGFYNTQTVRMENCLFSDAACRLLPPCYSSKCTQKYIYHRMMSWDPCDADRGFFIDVFRFPSACSCHIPTN